MNYKDVLANSAPGSVASRLPSISVRPPTLAGFLSPAASPLFATLLLPQPITWSSLTKGLVVIAAVAGLAASILTFARIGALRGDTIRLYMATDRAAGVIKGTEVWLGGQKVGLVRAVQFRPVNSDTTERLTIEMDILKKHAHHIRRDSDVQIRPGTSLIGEPVIYITVGSKNVLALTENDTIRARAQIEGRPSGASLISSLGDSLVGIANLTKQVMARADTTGDEIVKLRRRTEAQVNEVGRAWKNFTEGSRLKGTVARVTEDTLLHQTVRRISAEADSIRLLLSNTSDPKGSIGRFRHDSTLMMNIQSLQGQITLLQDRWSSHSASTESRGDKIDQEIIKLKIQLDSLVNDAKGHPFRYLSL